MECTNCSFFECVDKETNLWLCGDPQSWYNPKTADEVCRYQDGAVQRDPNNPTVPLSAVQEIIHEWFRTGGLTVFQYSNIVKEIKQKAGF